MTRPTSRWLRLCPSLALVFGLSAGCQGTVGGSAARPGSDDAGPHATTPGETGFEPNPDCLPLEHYFARRLWPAVVRPRCFGCHQAGGPGADGYALLDDGPSDANLAALMALAGGDAPPLLDRPLGGGDHGGGAVLTPDEPAYAMLETFVALVAEPPDCEPPAAATEVEPILLGPDALYRKVATSLGGRLPHAEERDRIAREGEAALSALLDALMREEGFYERLREGYNDILLTDAALVDRDTAAWGYLDEEHYPDRAWFHAYTPEEGRHAFDDATKRGLTRGPLELIVHVVREGLPFTEILTADYLLANPHAARSYGVFRAEDFDDPWDPDEFRPVSLPPVEGGVGRFPHAGLLSSYYYLHRYPSTPTNRNRHRARMVYAHFLDTDVMDFAPPGADPTEVASVDNPVRDAPQCAVCHRVIDPIAGAFQGYDDIGRRRPRPEGWYTDSFAPGFEGELLEPTDTERALPWLAQRIVADPRFADAVVGHAYLLLFGRAPLDSPDDPSASDFEARLVAYERQHAWLEDVSAAFVDGGYDFRALLQRLILSDDYRAAGLARTPEDPRAQAVAASLGATQLASPESLTRRLHAFIGQPWIHRYREPLLSAQGFRLLYGGIDSRKSTERVRTPNALMAGIGRLMANDVACRTVAGELERPPEERRFLPTVQLDDVPSDPAAEARIREAIESLHARLLGEEGDAAADERRATYELFVELQAEGARRVATEESSADLEIHCWQGVSSLRRDPDYTVRAWSGVVTYLLQTYELVYER